MRPNWVYAAWERRNETHFKATTEEFSKEHKLKAFEGQKICFFGFPADEHQHMVDVLKSNGGVPAELDDPECSHVVSFDEERKKSIFDPLQFRRSITSFHIDTLQT